MIPSDTSLLRHLTANFGSKGNRTQACGSLRGQPCKFDIALNYCTTRVIAWNNPNFIQIPHQRKTVFPPPVCRLTEDTTVPMCPWG